MKTQSEIRAAFWESFPQFRPGYKSTGYALSGRRLYVRKSQNDYPADVRMSFVDFVDSLARDGQISEKLAARVTL